MSLPEEFADINKIRNRSEVVVQAMSQNAVDDLVLVWYGRLEILPDYE